MRCLENNYFFSRTKLEKLRYIMACRKYQLSKFFIFVNFFLRYGDRTPHSIPARLFAVCWILLGITIFAMYTASITSVLTAEMSRKDEFTVFRKKVSIYSDYY